MFARDVMSHDPVTIDESKSVREAIELLAALDVRHLPVTSEGQLVGIVSDRDVRQLTVPVAWNASVVVETPEGVPNPADEPVTTVMSGGTLSIGPETPLNAIIDLICEHRVGALPVVDATGAVLGIVSYVDLLRALRPD